MCVSRTQEGKQRQACGTGGWSWAVGALLLAVAATAVAGIQIEVERPAAIVSLVCCQVRQRGFDRFLACIGRTIELAKLSSTFRRSPLEASPSW